MPPGRASCTLGTADGELGVLCQRIRAIASVSDHLWGLAIYMSHRRFYPDIVRLAAHNLQTNNTSHREAP